MKSFLTDLYSLGTINKFKMSENKNMKEKDEAVVEDAAIIEDEHFTQDLVHTESNDHVVTVDIQTSAILTAQTWSDKIEVAEAMIEGGLIPRSFAGDPGAVISAVEMGMELGLSPWTALNNIVVIQGKATLSLNAILALARSRGVLIRVLKDYELEEVIVKKDGRPVKKYDRATVIEITRGEDVKSPSGKLLDSMVSKYTYTKYWADAIKAELTTKDNWKRMPRQMLRARAITEALRLYAPDILLGIYETTELADPKDIIVDLKE